MSAAGRIVVAGGTGLIGRALVERWLEEGFEPVVLSRRVDALELPPGARAVEWDGRTVGAWASELEGARAVVNLAGESVAGARWSAERKRLLRSSRIEPAVALMNAINSIGEPHARPRLLLQASAIGYYGASDDRWLDESSPSGTGFLAELCRAWEAASGGVERLGVRRVVLRTGIVLTRRGGALARMLPAFRLGGGGPLGSGRQWFPWIHLDDFVAAVGWFLRHDAASGVFVLTAPQPVRFAEFAAALGQALRRPARLPIPAWALGLALGEMSQVLLEGQRAIPRRLLEDGFRFRFPELDGALADLVGARRK